VLLVFGKSLNMAKLSVGAAAICLGLVLYSLYESPDHLGRSTVHPAYGLYVALVSAAIALAVTTIWTLVLWLKRPPPPLTFPRLNEQFPRL
jgi:hypothetical protein